MTDTKIAHIDNICDFNQVKRAIEAHGIEVNMQRDGYFLASGIEVSIEDNCAMFWLGDMNVYDGIFAEINPDNNALMMTCVYGADFWRNTHTVTNADELANMLAFYEKSSPSLAAMYAVRY